MIATSPNTPAQKWELELDKPHSGNLNFILAIVIIVQPILIFFPQPFDKVRTTVFLTLSWLATLFAAYRILILQLYPQGLKFTDLGVELRMGKRTRSYSFSEIRTLHKNKSSGTYFLGFADRRYVCDITGEGVEAFMTELSARSGVEIKS